MKPAPVIKKQWVLDRLAARGAKQAALSRFLKISEAAVSNLLTGKRHLKAREAEQIATFLGCTVAEVNLAFGVRPDVKESGEKLRIKGYIGADDAVILYDEFDVGEGLDEIDAPFPGYTGCCVRIRGDSMSPRYLNGEVIAYHPNGADVSRMIGREAIVKCEDGRLVLKIIQRGSEPNTYTLLSVNPRMPAIQNVRVAWVAEIDWHKP